MADTEYVCTDLAVELPKHDADLDVIFPSGKKITLQWRTEGPSLDILLHEPESVYNWTGGEMKPAAHHKDGSCTEVSQLMLALGKSYLHRKKSKSS
jgi:hypothetical protein